MSAYLTVEESGHISVDDEGRKLLSQRKGRYSLASSTAGTLVWLRESSDADRGLPVFSGDLAGLEFSEVLMLLGQSRKTGILEIETESDTRCFSIVEGEVGGLSTNGIGERFSDVLKREGRIKPNDLKLALSECSKDRRLGRVLVDKKLLSERELWETLREYVLSVVHSILEKGVGRFAFFQYWTPSLMSFSGLSAEWVIMEAARRLDERRVSGAATDSKEELASIPTESADASTFARARLMAFSNAFREMFARTHAPEAHTNLIAAADSVIPGGFSEGDAAKEPVEDRLMKEALDEAKSGLRDFAEIEKDLISLLQFLLFVVGEHEDPETHNRLQASIRAILESDTGSK